MGLSFANGKLTLNFNLGIDTPAEWFATVLTSTGVAEKLWLVPIPAVVPPRSFTRTLGSGFPDTGVLTVLSGLETAPSEGLCYETVSVSTAQ